ncbi:DUF262 domain-containing protein [Sphingobacterium sp. lm-10]|uniref:DUF262 domain-containing protein n=1 Tax=Sphingobacterium sp. lm-10 TaxID=2944904 RepID=UPI002020805B|nr:DUF262 domain-containing protein [Sphingobacterium sp. lm-10]MCL7987060.1 DUF262 domain-containing protein [Sphingobacterium sp. lm-10]
MNNNLQLLPINDLMQYSFFVPSYQRGYRWTKIEAEALLKDLFTFMEKKNDEDDFYCLQPIVLAKSDHLEEGWDLIDGQQRLTTIFLILKFLYGRFSEEYRPKAFDLRYQTRVDSQKFLDRIDESLSNSNIDFYHIHEVFDTIKKFFIGKQNLINRFEDILLNRTFIIWFETSQESAIEVFTRINVGKIPLTNAELIKALFLKAENFKNGSGLKQIQISTEWDGIERKLRDPKLWYFINSTKGKIDYDNHIDFVFDLISKKKAESDRLHSFLHFYHMLGEENLDIEKSVEEVWLKIKQYFNKLEEWYLDRELYHYIGFLIEHHAINIEEAIHVSMSLDKDAYASWILGKIRQSLQGIELEELSFDSHKSEIKKVLLLFNIETLLQTEKAIFWFPFDKYKLEKWDIEHVNSQTQAIPNSKNYINWLSDLLKYFTGFERYSDEKIDEGETTYAEAVDEVLLEMKKDEQSTLRFTLASKVVHSMIKPFELAEIGELFEQLHHFFREGEISDNNGIENLALLDSSTNRSYKNAMFPIKRMRIIENDKNGVFVPIATKNLFLKYYSRQMSQALFWTKQDAKDYSKAMRHVLSKHLNNN